MLPLKKLLFEELRKQKSTELYNFSDDEINALLFHHNDGLRLSLAGFVMLKDIFTAYSFEIPLTLKAKHRFGMSKMEYPYFFTARRLILFSELDAMVVELAGGIEKFLENYTRG